MNSEQISAATMKNTSDIAALWESAKSAHKRIDENDRITQGIYELAANIQSLTMQVKLLAERLEDSVVRLEAGLKNQGERIGALEKEPGAKWKALVVQVLNLSVAAIIGGVAARFF